jgi:hypothetical protein
MSFWQKLKIWNGTTEVAVRINPNESEGELAINQKGHLCSENSTTTPLGIDGVFTGSAWQDTLEYGTITVGLHTDQASATDGLEVQWSHDGVSVDQTDVYTIGANSGKVFRFAPVYRYFRVKYTNGGVAQTAFHIQSILRRVYVIPSTHRIADSIINDDDAQLVKSVLTALNDNGNFVNINSTASNNLKVANVEDGFSIAKGDVVGHEPEHKFGNAPDFDTGDNRVTVWDGANDGGLNQMIYQYSATANIDRLSSSSASDTGDIIVIGLDTNWNIVIQTITLTGQTPVALTTSLIRVWRLENDGSSDFVGDIYCFVNGTVTAGVPDTPADVRAMVRNGNNKTTMAVYSIPAGYTGYVRSWYASSAGASKSTNYIIQLRARKFGKVFTLEHITSISDAGSSYLPHKYEDPLVFLEKTDLEMTAQITAASVTGGSVSAGFDLVLVQN